MPGGSKSQTRRPVETLKPLKGELCTGDHLS